MRGISYGKVMHLLREQKLQLGRVDLKTDKLYKKRDKYLKTKSTLRWTTSYSDILDKVDCIDPINYAKTRNYIDGAVTRLSPYISRGVISTKQVFEQVMRKGYDFRSAEKFVQELAWRDYWQQVWMAKGEAIDTDLKQPQSHVSNHSMPLAIVSASTGIKAINKAIEEFYLTGYMHNHMRLYIASITCNIARSHWYLPAKWMYFHLLDGDWASNALSWQWVAGSNSSKKYYANQNNINKYSYSGQHGSYLDVDYRDFASLDIPMILSTLIDPILKTNLPAHDQLTVDLDLPLCVYNSYNLDPEWRNEMDANRILLLEPSHFKKYPVSKFVLNFIIDLAQNIPGIQVYIGEFDQLLTALNPNETYFKEHPAATHYYGTRDERDWIFKVKGYYPSFFSYWKQCIREMKVK